MTFFPTLEEGITTIIDLGDTFDNRKSMDFNTFHRVRENYFDRLKDYKVHMLLVIIVRNTRILIVLTLQNFC